ncbi:MAG: AraC family transcriptional regulator, partial [Sphingobacteriaceae bacterium]
MLVEFVTDANHNFLSLFAGLLNVPVENQQLLVPASLGEGFVKLIDLDKDFRMLIHRYRLKEELVLKRIGTNEPASWISLIFYSNEEPVTLVSSDQAVQQFSRFNDQAIQIASNNLDSVITFPAHSEIYFTVVALSAKNLHQLLKLNRPDPLIETIIRPEGSFLFYESLSAEAQIILKQLAEPQQNGLDNFFYRTKVQSLLYYVFSKLHNRQSTLHQPINKADTEKLSLIRTAVLANLAQPPSLPQLAAMAGMSETKMKELFRQVFGDSIYNYYQTARMEEAAYLLRHKGYSVSEAGYALGFTNLSHFTR